MSGDARLLVYAAVDVVVLILLIARWVLPTAGDLTLPANSWLRAALNFIGCPIVALLIGLLFSFRSLARARHFTRAEILKFCGDCLGPTATILLVVGAGGGFNQVLLDTGVGNAIAAAARSSHMSPLLLASPSSWRRVRTDLLPKVHSAQSH